MLYIEYSTSRRICDLRCFDVNTLEYGMKKGNTIRSLEKYILLVNTYYLHNKNTGKTSLFTVGTYLFYN